MKEVRSLTESKFYTFENFQEKINYVDSLHKQNVLIITPTEYYDLQKDRSQYTPHYKPPRLNDYMKREGISIFKRLIARIQKKSRLELKEKENRARKIYEEDLEKFSAYDKRLEKKFYEDQETNNLKVCSLKKALKENDVDQTIKFVEHILYSDDFSVGFDRPYNIMVHDITYDSSTSELSFFYRIPDEDEIMIESEFEYDPENDLYKLIKKDQRESKNQRTEIARKVLLRAVSRIFLSDTNLNIQKIQVKGYFNYYDPSYGEILNKTGIEFNINRNQFEEISIERVEVSKLFNRLGEKINSQLYLGMQQ